MYTIFLKPYLIYLEYINFSIIFVERLYQFYNNLEILSDVLEYPNRNLKYIFCCFLFFQQSYSIIAMIYHPHNRKICPTNKYLDISQDFGFFLPHLPQHI